MLQAHSTALPHTTVVVLYCIIVCVLAATQLSSNMTETVCRVSRKRPDTPCGWQSCKNPWTAERAAYTVMGYCTTSSMAPLTSSCISGPWFLLAGRRCPATRYARLINTVARQTPRPVAVSALRSVANPTKICQLADYLITIPAREATKPHPRATNQGPEVPSDCISHQW